MRSHFPLFQTPLDLAHHYWTRLVDLGDSVVDATCGNGWDTVKLCQLALSASSGQVFAIDIQMQAIESTKDLLRLHLPLATKQRIEFCLGCHSIFPPAILSSSIKLIVYNLGYLPKGNKHLTTCRETTLQSLRQALPLLQAGGALSITCYPGHEEGEKEEQAVLEFATQLPPLEWSVCHHRWTNRSHSPSLLFIQKANHSQSQ